MGEQNEKYLMIAFSAVTIATLLAFQVIFLWQLNEAKKHCEPIDSRKAYEECRKAQPALLFKN